MMRSTIVLATIINIYLKAVGAKLTIVPKDTVVKIGETTFLNCSTNLSSTQIHWFHGNNFIYTGGEVLDLYSGRFRIQNSSEGAYNLVIQRVKTDDAGKYICQDDGGAGDKSEAELIIMEKDPVFKTNIDPNEIIGPNDCKLKPEYVQLNCSLSYRGNILPQMVWKRQGENINITEGVTNSSDGNTVTYSLTFNASDLKNNGHSFICETTEAKTMQYKCSTPDIKILYAFSNFTQVQGSVNTKYNCSANSSQTCSYKWKLFRGQEVLTVSDSKSVEAKDAGIYRCEAECKMKNENCQIEPIVVEIALLDTSPKEVSSIWMIFMVLVVIGILLTAMVIAVVCFIKRRKSRVNKELLENDHTVESLILNSNCGDIVEEKEKKENDKTEQIMPTDASPPLTSGENDVIDKDKERGQNEEKDRSIEAKPTRHVSHGKQIRGMAVSESEIYILTYEPIFLEIHNIHDSMFRSHSLDEVLAYPQDMAYGHKSHLLYVTDRTVTGQTSKTRMVVLDQHGKRITSWPTNVPKGKISVATIDGSIILAYPEGVEEYSPDGKLIRRIRVDKSVKPHFAIKMSDFEFLISRGQLNGDLFEVCLVKISEHPSTGNIHEVERIEKSFGKNFGLKCSPLKDKHSLAVFENKDVAVFDQENNRVIILDSDLTFRQEILLSTYGLQSPVKLCVADSDQQLIIAGNHVVVEGTRIKTPGILILSLS